MFNYQDHQQDQTLGGDEIFESFNPKNQTGNPEMTIAGARSPDSLLAESAFTSRFDKELQIGLEVRQQVTEKQHKGHMRAISVTWMN